MRTTIDIDDAIMAELREIAHRRRTSLKMIVNEALRRAVSEGERSGKTKPYKCPTYSMGSCRNAGFNMDKALHVADSLEDAEIARKLELRK